MKFQMRVADRDSGTEGTIVLDAADAASAEAQANQSGLFVAEVCALNNNAKSLLEYAQPTRVVKSDVPDALPSVTAAEPSRTQPVEHFYYNHQGFVVTRTRLVFQGTVYPLANVAAVTVGEVPPQNTGMGIGLIMVGLAIGLIGLVAAGGELGTIAVCVVFGLLLIGGGAAVLMGDKPEFVARIQTTAGTVDAMHSANLQPVQALIAAINAAIVDRG